MELDKNEQVAKLLEQAIELFEKRGTDNGNLEKAEIITKQILEK